jgi:hypothetical protein
MARCQPSALRPQMQERQETSRTVALIAHEDDNHFVINLHALHNATLLRKILPRQLTAPKPLYEDRRARHNEIAAGLRITQAEKRARTAAKTKATRDANKAKKHNQPVNIDAPENSAGGVQVQGGSAAAAVAAETDVLQGRNKRRRKD